MRKILSAPFYTTKTYSVILADPPWRYEAWNKPHEWQDDDGRWHGSKAAEAHYHTMEVDEIAALPVETLAKENCCLFLWGTMPMLYDEDCSKLGPIQKVMSAWGFRYSTAAFIWIKTLKNNSNLTKMGLGHWTRANAEICVLGLRGNPSRHSRKIRQIIDDPILPEPLREHSRKPDILYARIEMLMGLDDENSGDKIELFARQSYFGWDSWGNETGKFEV